MPTQAKYRKRCETLAKKLAVIRDKHTCQRCGRREGAMHGSHVKSVGKHPRLCAELINIKALCYQCHFYWWHSEPLEAAKWFKKKFPYRYKRLAELARETHKIDWEKKLEQLKKKEKSL